MRNRWLLLILAALFFGPVVIAWVLNVVAPGWLPFGTTNTGVLIQPVRPLSVEGLQSVADNAVIELDQRWTMLVLAPETCTQPCKDALFVTRQTRLGLGRDYKRLLRVLVLATKDAKDAEISANHPDLKVGYAPISWWDQLLVSPGEGTVYLVDPQQNLLLYYPPVVLAPDLISDLTRLLKISKIG